MTERLTFVAVLAISVICLAPCQSAAGRTEMLDQVFIASPESEVTSAFGVNPDLVAGQSFTVGRSGILSSIDVGLFRRDSVPTTITVDISRTVDGIADFSESGVLARRSVSSELLPIYIFHEFHHQQRFTLHVDFSDNFLQVNPGDTLAIILRPNAFIHSWWSDNGRDVSYPRGLFFQASFGQSGWDVETYDNGDAMFRTFVVAPEPASIGLSLLALSCIGPMRWRRL
jgi:hypothetical protein